MASRDFDQTFDSFMALELFQLKELFHKKWDKYGDSWMTSPFHFMVQRLVSDNPENKGELTELMEAIEKGDWTKIRDEGLDCINVLFMIVNKANAKLGIIPEQHDDPQWPKWNSEPYESYYRQLKEEEKK